MAETFYLFAGQSYYPRGGWDDYRGRYASVEAAQQGFDTIQQAATEAQACGDYDARRAAGAVQDWAHVVRISATERPEIVAHWWTECGWRDGPHTAPHLEPITAAEMKIWRAQQARLLPCGCEPETPLCAQPGGSCGRCVNHCTCTVEFEVPFPREESRA